MDIFKFNNPTSPTKMEQGEIINGLTRKLWIERYRAAGEFSLTANVSSGLREKLSIGSFISHVDTPEIMIIENHEINEDKDKETEIIITGRGIEAFFEHRVIGSNKTYPAIGAQTEYTLANNYSWIHARELILNHIMEDRIPDDGNALPYFDAISQVSGPGVQAQRIFKRGDLYSRLLEILDVDNLGVRIVRPGNWPFYVSQGPNTIIIIHRGNDKTAQVVFSYDTGEIESADYLWSNKKLKNSAIVTGKWVQVLVTTPLVHYDRRMIHIDASDIDNVYSSTPVEPALTEIINAMQQRGIQALAALKEIALTKAEVSKDNLKSIYRKDFDVGDLITVSGDYNESSSMRVSEYVEIEDENGKSGYPTLTMD